MVLGGCRGVVADLDRIYLAMDIAQEAMQEGCACGCLDEAREGLLEAMKLIEDRVGTDLV